jgi:hypothetical protein
VLVCSLGIALSTVTEKWFFIEGRGRRPVWVWQHDRGLAIQTLFFLVTAALARALSRRSPSLDLLLTVAVLSAGQRFSFSLAPPLPYTQPGQRGAWFSLFLIVFLGWSVLASGVFCAHDLLRRHDVRLVVFYPALGIAAINCRAAAMNSHEYGGKFEQSLSSLSNGVLPWALAAGAVSMALSVSKRGCLQSQASERKLVAAICGSLPFLLSAKEWFFPPSYVDVVWRHDAGKYTVISTAVMAAIAISRWISQGEGEDLQRRYRDSDTFSAASNRLTAIEPEAENLQPQTTKVQPLPNRVNNPGGASALQRNRDS